MTNSGFGSSVRRVLWLAVQFLIGIAWLPVLGHSQSPVTGLGRLYIEPLGNNLVAIITAEIIRQRLPVTSTRSEKESDCILLWIPLPENLSGTTMKKAAAKKPPNMVKMEGNMAIFDRQEKTIVWELNLITKQFDDLSLGEQEKLASKIVKGMKQRGAYCGGAPFSAAAQNAADRTKAFKPPTFNW